jgi:hypothetical protein
MKDEKDEKDEKEEKDENDIAFGLSSFLFLIPWAYSQFTFQKAFSVWTIALFILVFTSYVCNSYPINKKCQIVDHTVIILLSMIYFIYHRRLFIPIFLYILYVTELYFANDTKTTVTISFVALNLFAFTNFTRPELTVGIIMFTLAAMCKLYRNSKCQKTYPFYTTIWHVGCVVLLVLASRSINRLNEAI